MASSPKDHPLVTKSIRPIRVTNTLTGKKDILETLEPGKLTFYSCGPTVYGLIHVGNLRSALVADLFHRYLKRAGFDVCFVRNYTDVDDKIIRRAKEENMSPAELAKKYTQEVELDFAASGMLEPTHKTTVTDHISEIIEMIGAILDEKKAYVAQDGEVLFSINSFEGYGKLSHKKIEDLVAGQRVEVRDLKANPLDFSLWKPAKPGEPYWESPWGPGRPGWHIECSAMARKWLGDQIDLHHGGEDLIFPHHENEIAQSEAATGKAPFVKYWVHNAFLTMSKEKMSKSLGNIFSAREFLKSYSGEVARYLLLSAHYRSIIDFSEESIENALSGLARIYEAKKRAVELKKGGRARADMRAENLWGEFVASCQKAREEMDEHFANDFNTPGALGTLFSLIREFNRTLAEPLAPATPSAHLGADELIALIEKDLGGILGVGLKDPDAGLEDLSRIRQTRSALNPASGATARLSSEEILKAIAERGAARKAKDFARADAIRKDLESKGVLIKDRPDGTTVWEYS